MGGCASLERKVEPVDLEYRDSDWSVPRCNVDITSSDFSNHNWARRKILAHFGDERHQSVLERYVVSATRLIFVRELAAIIASYAVDAIPIVAQSNFETLGTTHFLIVLPSAAIRGCKTRIGHIATLYTWTLAFRDHCAVFQESTSTPLGTAVWRAHLSKLRLGTFPTWTSSAIPLASIAERLISRVIHNPRKNQRHIWPLVSSPDLRNVPELSSKTETDGKIRLEENYLSDRSEAGLLAQGGEWRFTRIGLLRVVDELRMAAHVVGKFLQSLPETPFSWEALHHEIESLDRLLHGDPDTIALRNQIDRCNRLISLIPPPHTPIPPLRIRRPR
jgi:hypothetical protein